MLGEICTHFQLVREISQGDSNFTRRAGGPNLRATYYAAPK
jgi:hypothetical protein